MEAEPDCPQLPWMVDFHCTQKDKILNAQFEAAFADDYIDHLCKLNIDSEVPKKRLTGIICTMGPSCMDQEIIENMIDAGMTMMKIKLSYYSLKECKSMLETIQKAVYNFSKKSRRIFPLGIIIEIKGPEIRTGRLKNVQPDAKCIKLQQGKETAVTADLAYEEFVTEDMIYVDYQKINEVIEPGDNILIDSIDRGQVQLSALKIVGSIIQCIIQNTGRISNHASVSLDGVATDLPTLTDFDIEALKMCAKEKVSAVFVGQVQNAESVKEVRNILGKEGRSVMVVAKIQNPQGIYNIDDILMEADGVLIERSSLARELPLEKLFLVQKLIIGKCNKVGIPVICATSILESMSNSIKPTNAEIIDVANAIADGTDCFLLTKETSVGKYPIQTIKALAAICKEAEAATFQKTLFDSLTKTVTPIEPLYAIAIAATEASMKCNAAAIIVATVTGRAAKVLSRFKPRCPIIAITRYSHIAQTLNLWRGVHPIHYIKKPLADWLQDIDKRVQFGLTFGKYCGYIKTGDALIIITGTRTGSGFTNSMRIVYASEFDTVKHD